MNALFEFIIISAVSFFLFMFLGYRDAIRTSAPKGMLANLFNNLSFWKAEDEAGIRGYLYKQNIILKVVVAFIGALLIRFIYALIFDFSVASETFNIFTGLSSFFMHVGIIVAAIYLSYLWPSVTKKIIDVKDEAVKDQSEKDLEKAVQSKGAKPEPETTKASTPEPKEPPKKEGPNDIINDYLN